MTVTYVLAAFPKVSETFVSGEIAALRGRGVDVAIFSLRHPRDPGPQHPGDAELARGTTYLPSNRLAWPRLALAALGALVRSPVRATRTLSWGLLLSVTGRSRGDVLRFAQAAYVARRLPATTQHIRAHFAHGPATCAAMVSRLSGVPFSFTAHARDIFEHADPRCLRDKTAAAQAVIAISEHGRQRVIELVGAQLRDRVRLVRNGIDLGTFRRRAAEPDSRPLLLSVGRLVEKKGQADLIRATALLVQRGYDVHCQIVGEGPLLADLQATAKGLDIADRVTFSGALPAPDVLAAYDRATVMALPCTTDANGDQDGLPVCLVEAMAVGVPVVSTRLSGIPELVEDGVSGLLVQPHDVPGLAGALQCLLDDPALRLRFADAGRRVAESYDRTVTTQQLIEAIGLAGTVPQPVPDRLPGRDTAGKLVDAK